MLIDTKILDELSERARGSERLRMNLDLRNSAEDGSQRMLNALEPGTVMPIHRHPETSETVVVLRGSLDWVFYDDDARETARFHVAAGSDVFGINVPAGQWHNLENVESGTVLFEAKDGKYYPVEAKDILCK